MKKWIAAILCFCVIFSITGCNKEEKEMKTDIVGEWMTPAINAAAVFNEDGTGYLEYNGKNDITWRYDADRDCYVVSGAETQDALIGKEYDMDYMSFMGADFYRPEDYDKAFTLLISKRFEAISMFTENMDKIELNKTYDLLNGVTIEFSDVTKDSSGKGLLVSYTVTNYRNEAVTEGLRSLSKGQGFFAEKQDADDLSGSFQWAESLEAGESVTDVLPLMSHENTGTTIDRYNLVIGAICFEFSCKNYFFDLSDWLKAEKVTTN